MSKKEYMVLSLRISSVVTTDGESIDLRVRAPCKVTIDKNHEWVKFGGNKKFQLSKLNDFDTVRVLNELREVCEFPEEEQRAVLHFTAYRRSTWIIIGAEDHEFEGVISEDPSPYSEEDNP